MQNRYVYDAYGATQSASGTTVNSYQYTGQQLDSATGLYDLRARYYDPSVGHYISRDSHTCSISISSCLNRYEYSKQSPVNFVDPTGLFEFPALITRIGAVTAAALTAFAANINQALLWIYVRLDIAVTSIGTTLSRILSDVELQQATQEEVVNNEETYQEAFNKAVENDAPESSVPGIRLSTDPKNPQQYYPDSNVPKTFFVQAEDGTEFYVPKSGSVHLDQLVTGKLKLDASTALTWLRDTVSEAVKQGAIQYGQNVCYGNHWQIIFSQSRGEGFFPAIVHALWSDTECP